jgi:uncharacterized phage protein (TIGR01671 family)
VKEMKHIKFRAWDQADQDFWEPSGMIYFDIYSVPKFIGHTFHKKDSDHYESRYLIDQFTGHLDSNDVEIYEGDVVKVVREDGCFGRNNYTEIDYVGCPSWSELEPIVTGGPDGCDRVVSIEVIGNIHQNPELLK